MFIFVLWMGSVLALEAGYFWMRSNVPFMVDGLAVLLIVFSLVQMLLMALIMPQLVNGACARIKSRFAAYRLSEAALQLSTWAIVFPIATLLDVKHLRLHEGFQLPVAFVSTIVTSLLVITVLTGGHLSKTYHKQHNHL